MIALTFDDGPDPVWTPKLLDLLDAAQVKATFYVVGAAAAAWPDLVVRIFGAGHELGTQGLTHAPAKITPEEYAKDFWMGVGILQRIIPEIERHNFRHRLPHGYQGERDIRLDCLIGWHSDGWNIDSEDWKQDDPPNGKEIATSIERQIRRDPYHHHVILFHDGIWANGRRWPDSRQATLDAVRCVLVRSGEFGTVSQWEAASRMRAWSLLNGA